MSRTYLLLATTMFTVCAAGGAYAQDPVAERLSTVTVDDERPAARRYRFGDPVDSGTSVIDEAAIAADTPGSGDVNQLLKALPTAQFSLDERSATREDLQDIRPEQISISGGRPYDNLFLIDGIGVNSQLDTSDTTPFDFNEVAGATPQTIWLDSGLIGAISVRDSNVSARFGGFTGGVVEVETRDPSRGFGMTATYSATSTDLTSFKLSDASSDRLAGDLPPEPDYDKQRWGLSLDLPISDRLRLLAGYNHSSSEVVYQRSANYGGGLFGQSSTSENYLLKANANLPAGVTLDAQVAYSPYESEASNANGINNLIVSNGGGLVGSVRLEGDIGGGEWSLKAGYASSRTDRDSPENNFSRPSAAPSVNYCSSTNCTEGGFGSIRQRQDSFTLSGDYEAPLWNGDMSFGFDFQRVEAQKRRLQTNRAYQTSSVATGSLGPNVVCESASDPACVTGEYALTRYQEYRAYDARADVADIGLWGEYRLLAGGFDVRAGLRFGYESFLGHSTWSPRISVAHDLPFGMTGTVGLNRYYGRSFLGYAIREQYPDNYTYQRTARVSGAQRIFSENWTLSSTSRGTRYSDADLKTPYSDELTLALSGQLFGGEWRARGILREGRDEFARSSSERLVYNPETGGTSTFTSYTVTNEGETAYQGLSLEYLRDFGRHTLSLSTNLSKTTTNAENYFETSDDDLFDSEQVFYQGQVISLLDILRENQRLDFASPFIVNASLSSSWWGGRLQTTLNGRFRDGFEQIGDTGTTQLVEGVRYDVWDVLEYDPSVTFNLNASLDIARAGLGSATLDLRVDNVFDTIPNNNSVSVAQPYQLGRVMWVGLKVRY